MALTNKLTKTMNELFSIDEQIKSLNSKTKYLKKDREIIENQLMDLIKKNNLEDKKFLFNDRKIFLNKYSTLPPLNIKMLEQILNNNLDKSKQI